MTMLTAVSLIQRTFTGILMPIGRNIKTKIGTYEEQHTLVKMVARAIRSSVYDHKLDRNTIQKTFWTRLIAVSDSVRFTTHLL